MAATLQLIANLLALAAVCSALPIQSVSAPPIQPVSSIFPYTISTTVSGISFSAPTRSHPIAYSTDRATQALGLTARTNPSTQPSMASSATATNATTSTQDQSSWNSSVISTVVFGCIASILGVLAIWATMLLGRRQTNFAARNNIDSSQARKPGFILEGITNSASIPKSPELQHPWTISPRSTRAHGGGRSVIEAPPPAHVPSNVRI